MYFNPYALPVMITGLLVLVIAIRIFRFKRSERTVYFSLLCLCAAIYSLAYAMEISTESLATMLFWLRVEYIGIAFIPTFFILFALAYTGRGEKISPVLKVALYLFSLITIALVFTLDQHSLMHQTPALNTQGPFPVLSFGRGIWYWLHSLYVVGALTISSILFFVMWLTTNPVYRSQITAVLLGSLIPWTGFIFYQARPFAWEVDIMPFCMSLSVIFIFLGMARYRFLELIPVARARLFEELPDGVVILDAGLRLVDYNAAAAKMLNLSQQAIGAPLEETLSGWEKLAKALKPAAKRYYLEIKDSSADKPQWYRCEFIPLVKGKKETEGRMIIIRDITESKETEEKLNILATTDSLTGLWNRRHFMQVAEKEMKRARRYDSIFSLLMIDIDRFKNVNDNYGHSAGDRVLIELAKTIKSRLRGIDVVARLGGEEFGVLLPETGANGAFNLAEDIRTEIAATPVIVDDKEISYTVSIGVTAFHQGLTNIDSMLKNADQALYRAKDQGRNRTVVK